MLSYIMVGPYDMTLAEEDTMDSLSETVGPRFVQNAQKIRGRLSYQNCPSFPLVSIIMIDNNGSVGVTDSTHRHREYDLPANDASLRARVILRSASHQPRGFIISFVQQADFNQ
jgi:hypothetical protein